jgi:hypothetical protein
VRGVVAVDVGDGVAVGLGDGVGLGDVVGVGEPVVHAAPFTVKAAGSELDPLNEPLKPIEVLPPVASAPFQLSLVTVTFSPDCDQVPFQPLVTPGVGASWITTLQIMIGTWSG